MLEIIKDEMQCAHDRKNSMHPLKPRNIEWSFYPGDWAQDRNKSIELHGHIFLVITLRVAHCAQTSGRADLPPLSIGHLSQVVEGGYLCLQMLRVGGSKQRNEARRVAHQPHQCHDRFVRDAHFLSHTGQLALDLELSVSFSHEQSVEPSNGVTTQRAPCQGVDAVLISMVSEGRVVVQVAGVPHTAFELMGHQLNISASDQVEFLLQQVELGRVVVRHAEVENLPGLLDIAEKLSNLSAIHVCIGIVQKQEVNVVRLQRVEEPVQRLLQVRTGGVDRRGKNNVHFRDDFDLVSEARGEG